MEFSRQEYWVGCHCLLQCFPRFTLYSILSIVLIIILKPTISRIFEIILDALLYLIWDILRWTQQPGSPIISDVTLLFNACLCQSLPIGWRPLADWAMPCSLVVQSLSPVQLCDSTDCSTPGSSVLHYLPEFAQTMSIESVMPSNHLILCHPLLLLPSIFPSIRVSPMSQLFESGGQSIGTSASTKTFYLLFRVWSPLRVTGLISLRSQGLSRVFSNTTDKKISIFGTQRAL